MARKNAQIIEPLDGTFEQAVDALLQPRQSKSKVAPGRSAEQTTLQRCADNVIRWTDWDSPKAADTPK